MSNLVNPHTQITSQTITATTSAAQCADNGARTVFIRSAKANTVTTYVGGSTVTNAGGGSVLVDLQPGEGIFYDIKNSNLLWVVAASATAVIYVSVFE